MGTKKRAWSFGSALFFGLWAAGPGFADVISLRADPYCPYNCKPDSERPGYLIEIARAVFEPAGHTIDYRSLNWSRALAEARKGQYDGVVGGLKSDAPDFVYPDVPLGSAQFCFYTKKSSAWSYSGVASLSGITLGVVANYSFGETLDPYIKANAGNVRKIDAVSGDAALDSNVKKLLLGRVGAVLDDAAVVSFYLAGKKLTDETRVAGCDGAKEIYIGFSPANPKSKDRAALLAAGLETLRASGELAKILERYGLKDWK